MNFLRRQPLREASFPIGLEELYTPLSPPAKVDIVFIHGLNGHPKNTWTHEASSIFWPRDILPVRIPYARILTFGYDARVTSWQSAVSKNRVGNHAKTFLMDLANLRLLDETDERSIIFVAHSLGGLVCKDMLLASRNSATIHERQILECTKGIMFLGTPHSGSGLASWAEGLAVALGTVKQTNNALLKTIRSDSEVLERINTDFHTMIRARDSQKFEIICYYEEVPLRVVKKMVVPKESSILDAYPHVGIPSNHMDMARFLETDIGFRRISDQLCIWIRNSWSVGLEEEREEPSKDQEAIENMKESFNESLPQTHRELADLRTLTNASTLLNESTLEEDSYITDENAKTDDKTPTMKRALTMEEKDCLRALAFPEMDQRGEEVKSASNGTCAWLFEHPEYRKWSAQTQSLLWIKGKPGAGKSTILKHALKRDEEAPLKLSFFFHGRGVEIQKSPIGLYRALCHQLLSQIPDSLGGLVRLFIKKCDTIGKPGGDWEWRAEELRDLFEQALLKAGKLPMLLFVDALDECGEDAAVALAKDFQSMMKTLDASSQLRVCFACRHYPILTLKHGSEICVEDENKKDIETYVETELLHEASDGHELAQAITSQAFGSFQWAYLVTKRVLALKRKGKSAEEIDEELKQTPKDLNELYTELVRTIHPEDKPDALKLIEWVCFAFRPLSLDVIHLAMALEVDGPKDYESYARRVKKFASDDESLKRKLTTLSCGLIEIQESGDRLVAQFIHQSVQDFLLQSGMHLLTGEATDTAIGKAHHRLSRMCFRYITMDEVIESTRKKSEIKSPFLLLNYSVTAFMEHAAKAEARSVPQDDLLACFGAPSKKLLRYWTRLYRYRGADLSKNAGSTYLHLASFYGLESLARAISRSSSFDAERNAKDSYGRTPLFWAARKGFDGIVELLIASKTTEVDAKDVFGRTALLWASRMGHDRIVRRLLAREDVDADVRGVDGRTPLSWAASNGHEHVARLLLSRKDINADLKDRAARTPLSWAVAWGHEGIARMLLARSDVETNSRDRHKLTPLGWAARNGEERIVKMLLARKDIEVDTKDEFGRTPLASAAQGGHEVIVKILLTRNDVDAGSEDVDGRTPLSWAAQMGNKAITELLLARRSIRADHTSSDGRTPLSWAAVRGFDELAKTLLARGDVQTNSRDQLGMTPLMCAVKHHQPGVIELLLAQSDIEADARDLKGRTPLLVAAKNGQRRISELLLTHKVDINVKDNEQRAPFWWAVHGGHAGVVRMFLEHGKLEPDTEDYTGQTPLMIAAYRGYEEIAGLLLRRADVQADAKDKNGRTALSWAAARGHDNIVRLLLDRDDVDRNAEGSSGQTPLHWAEAYNHMVIVAMLREGQS